MTPEKLTGEFDRDEASEPVPDANEQDVEESVQKLIDF